MSITRNTSVVIGDADWCYVADPDLAGHSLTGSTPSYTIEADGVEHMDKRMHSVDTEISLTSLYYRTLVKGLNNVDKAICFSIWPGYTTPDGQTATDLWEGGFCVVGGLPETAASDNAITSSVSMRPSEPWSRGLVAAPFELRQGALSAALGSLVLTGLDTAWMVITENSGDRSVKVKRGAAEQAIPITGPSIKKVDLAGFTTKTAVATSLETTGLTGSAVTSGWLLLGSTYKAP